MAGTGGGVAKSIPGSGRCESQARRADSFCGPLTLATSWVGGHGFGDVSIIGTGVCRCGRAISSEPNQGLGSVQCGHRSRGAVAALGGAADSVPTVVRRDAQRGADPGDAFLSLAIAQQSIVPDFHEPSRQQVQTKAADKLRQCQCQRFASAAIGVIFKAECDLGLRQREQTPG